MSETTLLCAHPFVSNEYFSLKIGCSDFGVHRNNLKLGLGHMTTARQSKFQPPGTTRVLFTLENCVYTLIEAMKSDSEQGKLFLQFI